MAMSNNKGNGGNRVRPIGVMLLVAFGAAMLGVMVLHKLRERRIFHLLVKEKDRDLVSLHLLLQKERDLGQEMKRKNEEMRGKILALTTHKAEVESRLSEMRSTIALLKDEQRSAAMALEEKQNEIKMLREKGDSQLAEMAERLKQREAEVEVTNPAANVNVTVAISDKEETEQDEDKESVGEGEGNSKAQAGGDFGGIANATETRNEVGELNGEILQKTDGDSKLQDHSGTRAKGSRGKGRSRRVYARHRRLEKNGDAENDGARSARRLRSRRLYKDVAKIEMSKAQGEDQIGEGSIVLKTTEESGLEDKKPDLRQEHKLPSIRDDEARSKVDAREEMHSPEAKKQNTEETEHTKDQEAENQSPEDTKDQMVKEPGETTKIFSPRDGEVSEEDVNSEKDAEEVKVREEHEDEEETEIADKKEEKTDAGNDDFFRNPRSNSDVDTEEYKEETDESEF